MNPPRPSRRDLQSFHFATKTSFFRVLPPAVSWARRMKNILQKKRDGGFINALFPVGGNDLGFTLIEIIISLSVFIIVVTIAVGGFVGALRSQRQGAALISPNNNVSLALEQMTREIRTGRNFCDPLYSPPCSFDALKFYNALGELVTYKKNTGVGDFIERGVFDGSTDVFERITGIGAFVWSLEFHLKGEDPADDLPTRVTITIGVSAKERGISEGVIRLQTTISSRQADE